MFAFIGHDSEQAKELRPKFRQAHLDKLKALTQAGKVFVAGPLTDGAGSLIIFNMATRSEVELVVKTDPYVMERVFESYEIHPFEKVLP